MRRVAKNTIALLLVFTMVITLGLSAYASATDSGEDTQKFVDVKSEQDQTGQTDPVDQSDPAEPTDPVDPAEPTDPVDPAEPTDPVDPVEPTDPIDPENPEGSVVPTDPLDPTNPIDPNIPITGYLEYTIQYYFTTFDGEDVKGEMIEEVSFEDPIVTFENLPKPEDLPEGYVIDETMSTKLPFTVTEEENVIEVYYIPSTPKVLEYTIYYLFTTLDGEDVEGEMKGEVSSADPVVTVDNLPMPEDLPMGYVIDEENSTLPYEVTEEDNEIYVYYVPGMMRFMPMALASPGSYTSGASTIVVKTLLEGVSTNSHTKPGLVWQKDNIVYVAVKSTHALQSMKLTEANSTNMDVYNSWVSIYVDGVEYKPNGLGGNTNDSHWSVIKFNLADLTIPADGKLPFYVYGIGGGHDVGGTMVADVPKIDIVGNKAWVGGADRPSINLQLKRYVEGSSPDTAQLVPDSTKTVNGIETPAWTYEWVNMLEYSILGTKYIYYVDEEKVPSSYEKTIDVDGGRTVTNTYKAGKLSITKNVTGNLRDTSKAFKISIKFTLPEGLVNSNIKYKNPSDEYSDYTLSNYPGENIIEIELKDGETGSFEDIPYGVKFEVVEEDYTGEGYDSAVIDNPTGTIEDENISVIITNNKDTLIDTGISLDNLPYIIMLALSGLGALGIFIRKRKYKLE